MYGVLMIFSHEIYGYWYGMVIAIAGHSRAFAHRWSWISYLAGLGAPVVPGAVPTCPRGQEWIQSEEMNPLGNDWISMCAYRYIYIHIDIYI